jgi:hypothetical protein
MIQRVRTDDVTLPTETPTIAEVKILDAEGRVLRIVPAEEFRRAAKAAAARVEPIVDRRARRAARTAA